MVTRSGGGSEGAQRKVEPIGAVVRHDDQTTPPVEGQAHQGTGCEYPDRRAILFDAGEAAHPSQCLGDIEVATRVEGQPLRATEGGADHIDLAGVIQPV